MEGCTRDPSHVHVRERRALRVNKHDGVGGQDMIGGPMTPNLRIDRARS